jgi:phosphonate transport system substrate-binding protein
MQAYSRLLLSILVFSVSLGLTCLAALPGQSAPSSAPEILRAGYPVGAFSEVDLKDAQAALEIWMRQLTNEAEFPLTAKVTIYSDEASMIAAIKHKEVDLVILSSPLYLRIKDSLPLEPVFVPSMNSIVGDEFLLLVPRDAGITTMNQLKNRRILIQSGNSPHDSHILWINSLLKKNGGPNYERFFQTIKTVDKPSQAILPVFFKQTDACLVFRRSYQTVVELNPQVGHQLLAIAQSLPILRGLLVLRKDYSDKIKKVVMKTMTELHTHPQGKQILTLLKYDKLVRFKPEYLHSIALLCNEMNESHMIVTGQQNKRKIKQ